MDYNAIISIIFLLLFFLNNYFEYAKYLIKYKDSKKIKDNFEFYLNKKVKISIFLFNVFIFPIWCLICLTINIVILVNINIIGKNSVVWITSFSLIFTLVISMFGYWYLKSRINNVYIIIYNSNLILLNCVIKIEKIKNFAHDLKRKNFFIEYVREEKNQIALIKIKYDLFLREFLEKNNFSISEISV